MVEAAGSNRALATPPVALRAPPRRPQTHCGSLQRPSSGGSFESAIDDEAAADAGAESACSSAGAAAFERSNGCRSCGKLLIRLEHAERARVKAQEQLARLQSEGLCRSRPSTQGAVLSSPRGSVDSRCSSPCARGLVDETPVEEGFSGSMATNTGAGMGCGPLAADEDVGRSLESYRREVAILRNTLKQRDSREAELAEAQRKLRSEHESSKREWEEQVAGLLCEVQDVEARNRQLEDMLRSLASSNGVDGQHSISLADVSAVASGADLSQVRH